MKKLLDKTHKKTQLTLRNRELRIIISPICNLNYFYCHREGIPKVKIEKKIAAVDQNIASLPKIFDFSKRAKEITITGGEPTLFPSYVEKLIDYFRNKTDNLTLISNGTAPQFLLKHARYFTEIHLHIDVLNALLRKKLMGRSAPSESRIKKLAQGLNKRTNLRINSVVEDKYPIESFLELLLWSKNNNIKIGFIKPLLKESKNFEVLKKLISLTDYKKVKQKNIRKIVYKSPKGHIIEFILCRCDVYKNKNLSSREVAKRCLNSVLNFNLSNGKLSFCFLGKEMKPQKFLDLSSKFSCHLMEKIMKTKSKDSTTKEYEIRCPIQNVKEIGKKIGKQKSFVFKKRKRVCDFIYYPKRMDKSNKFKKGDTAIRLRITRFAGRNKAVLNIKKKINSKEWFEWETSSVKKPVSLILILNKVYRPKMILDRIRTTYLDSKTETKIEIDEFRDTLGNFVEIEGEKNIAKSLHLKLKLKKFPLAYGDIMNQNIRKHRISFTTKDFVKRFTNITRSSF